MAKEPTPVVRIQSLTNSKLDRERLDAVYDDIRDVYRSDDRPWVIGYSGGKDSTTTLQLIWYALDALPREQLTKPVYVLSSDTLVETPVIVDTILGNLQKINKAAQTQGMPFRGEVVRPQITESFWVNLIGRGYPAPYNRFRWCTDRMKIKPANRFIMEQVTKFGEVIMVLGVRRSESATRAQVMSLHKRQGERLSRHTDLTGAWVYTPIEDWSLDDVWTYLLSIPNPWGSQNRDLVAIYKNAQAGECPLVVDKTTSSCGNSRFGCWVCTVVERDRSMEAMIENGEEWMEPMLEFRDFLASTQDPAVKKQYRDFRRRDGKVMKKKGGEGRLVYGPYKFEFRKELLRRLLDVQQLVRKHGPDPTGHLISREELNEVRRIWRSEEGDWEDSLPQLVAATTGEQLDWIEDDLAGGGAAESKILKQICDRHELPQKLILRLLEIEREHHGMSRRAAIYDQIDRELGKDWRSEEEVYASLQEDDGAS